MVDILDIWFRRIASRVCSLIAFASKFLAADFQQLMQVAADNSDR